MISKAIITVSGKDTVGIIHAITGKLLDYNANVLEINQVVVSDYFTMIDRDITGISDKFDELKRDLIKVGKAINQEVMVQHEDILIDDAQYMTRRKMNTKDILQTIRMINEENLISEPLQWEFHYLIQLMRMEKHAKKFMIKLPEKAENLV